METTPFPPPPPPPKTRTKTKTKQFYYAIRVLYDFINY